MGYEAALDLARRHRVHVVLGCRNLAKGQAAVAAILQQGKNDATAVVTVECLELDLASLESVRRFAATIQSRFQPDTIHSIVLNAGVWVPMGGSKAEKTNDGFEVHFGVNHLAHFLLVQTLKDHLAKSSSDSRIVFVSSSLLKSGQIDLEKQDFVYDGRRADEEESARSFAPTAYCDSKLMNALTCRHLATILPPNVTTYALCPGFCRSRLGRHVSFAWYKKILIAPILLLIQRTAAQGAQNIVFAVVQDKSKLQSGAIYQDGQIMTKEMEYMDSLGSDVPKKLWDLSEKLTMGRK